MQIAILTAFSQLQPGYSLTGVVRDQAMMLRAHGHKVDVFGNEDVKELIPFFEKIVQKDYETAQDLTAEHEAFAKRMAAKIQSLNYDFIFTHDFAFQGWYLPHGFACIEASRFMPVKWLHWIHSIPSQYRDWWRAQLYDRTKHRFIYPNETDRLLVAEQYRTDIDMVRTIPHIRDLRTWFDFSPESCEIIARHPGIMEADIVQIYPASSDKLEIKGLDNLIGMFAAIKKVGASVQLVIANQWTHESVEGYRALAKHLGLEEIVFTSDLGYKEGLSPRVLRELMMCSNLFIYPTKMESFGLVLPEALLASGCFPVLNKSLRMMREVSEGVGLWFDFGSFDVQPEIRSDFFDRAARVILGRMRQNEAVMAKTVMRQKYNWNNVFSRYYSPVLAESATWR